MDRLRNMPRAHIGLYWGTSLEVREPEVGPQLKRRTYRPLPILYSPQLSSPGFQNRKSLRRSIYDPYLLVCQCAQKEVPWSLESSPCLRDSVIRYYSCKLRNTTANVLFSLLLHLNGEK